MGFFPERVKHFGLRPERVFSNADWESATSLMGTWKSPRMNYQNCSNFGQANITWLVLYVEGKKRIFIAPWSSQ
jgi:hypothetical protein